MEGTGADRMAYNETMGSTGRMACRRRSRKASHTCPRLAVQKYRVLDLQLGGPLRARLRFGLSHHSAGLARGWPSSSRSIEIASLHHGRLPLSITVSVPLQRVGPECRRDAFSQSGQTWTRLAHLDNITTSALRHLVHPSLCTYATDPDLFARI